jgi:hypothetical protein
VDMTIARLKAEPRQPSPIALVSSLSSVVSLSISTYSAAVAPFFFKMSFHHNDHVSGGNDALGDHAGRSRIEPGGRNFQGQAIPVNNVSAVAARRCGSFPTPQRADP